MTLLAAVLLAGATVSGAAQDTSDVRRHYVWQNARGDHFAEGVSIARLDDSGFVLRWWVMTPENHRVVLTNRMDLETCSLIGEIRDRETGWWAERRDSVRLGRRCTMDEMENVATLMAKENPLVVAWLRTRDGFSASVQARAMEEGEDPPASFAAALATANESSKLAPETLEELRFLGALARRKDSQLHHVAQELLQLFADATSAGPASDYDEVGWEEGRDRIHLGKASSSRATYRELLDRFGVDPEKPFADLAKPAAGSK